MAILKALVMGHILKRALVIAVLLLVWFLPWVFVPLMGFHIYFPYRPDGETRFVRITGPLPSLLGADWAGPDEIPNACLSALVASEDATFYEHHGVDFDGMIKAWEYNQKHPNKVRGGSTITQQLVKNLFLSRERSLLRKGREFVGSLILDALWSKEQQLVWYFNAVEFGPNVYGITAASQKYFGVFPQDLNASQCVSLVAILPAPRKWNRSLEKKSLTSFFLKRMDTISTRMKQMDIVDAEDFPSLNARNVFAKKPAVAKNKPTLKPASSRKTPAPGKALPRKLEPVEEEDGEVEATTPSPEHKPSPKTTEGIPIPPAPEALAPTEGPAP